MMSVNAAFTHWDMMKAALVEAGEALSSGVVTLGTGKAISCKDVANVVLGGYSVAIEESAFAGPGFASCNEPALALSESELESRSGKGYDHMGKSERVRNYSSYVCRAGVFARLVSLVLARCGVRSAIAQLLVDLLNNGIAPVFTSDDLAGKELCLTLVGSSRVSVYTASGEVSTAALALQAANLRPVLLSKGEADTLLKGQFLCTGAACWVAYGAYNALKAADGVSALTCEALGVSVEGFSTEQFEVARQHRGQMNCAEAMRILLEGSKRTGTSSLTAVATQACLTIPQVHGPASDIIAAAIKSAELELNSSEIGPVSEDGLGLDPSQMLLAMQSVSSALFLVNQASLARGVLLGSPQTNSSLLQGPVCDMYDFNGIDEQLRVLVAHTKQELKLVLAMLEGIEAEAGPERVRGDGSQNPNKPAVDESNWTPAQKAKAEAARKKKEEKKAAQSAGKKKGGLGLGAGTSVLYERLKGSGENQLLALLNPYSSGELGLASATINIIQDLNSSGKRKPKTPKGTRDYGPEQMRIREHVFQTIRRVFKRHGGVEIDTPVFELKEILMGKYGEDTKLIYDLADQGGELLSLRYDLTVPFARFLAMNSVGNIKRYHIAKVYRRDQPQMNRGRYREFYQCDFDIAGAYTPMTADAEAITIATEILTLLPVGKFCVKINHRVLLDAIFEIAGVPPEKFRPICSAVDKLDKESWAEVSREMVEEKGLSREVAEKIGTFVLKTSKPGRPQDLWQQMMEEKTFGDHAKAGAAMLEMQSLFSYLEAMGSIAYVSFDMSLARGLDYYTGLIYEIVVLDGTTAVGSIAAGGRYDNLVGMFSASGTQTPCVGISIGIERVFTIMEKKAAEKKMLSADIVQCYVASIGGNSLAHRMKIAQLLWKANIATEYSVKENPKLKTQMDDCLERGIPFMVIFGESEMASGVVKIKDMNAHTEMEVKLEEVVAALIAAGCATVTHSDTKFLDALRD